MSDHTISADCRLQFCRECSSRTVDPYKGEPLIARQVGSCVFHYYEKAPSFFVTGDIKPHIDAFITLRGRSDRLQVVERSGKFVDGWVFTKKAMPEVEQYLTSGQLPMKTPETVKVVAWETVDKFTAAYHAAEVQVYTRQKSPYTIEILITGPKGLTEEALVQYKKQWTESCIKMRLELGDHLEVMLTRMGQV